MSRVYYNEIDQFCAAWLKELMKAGQIPDGEVDTRSIELVHPDDLRGFTQCHFFAGIGGWAYALKLVGWPDEREVWTGSCPCQPFSAAGKADGADDPRHLWPTWFQLISECHPLVCFGEQVASADGLGWFDRVSTDLEAAGYAVGASDLCAASVGAFHIRQRLWFVAEFHGAERASRPNESIRTAPARSERTSSTGIPGDVADTNSRRLEQWDSSERPISIIDEDGAISFIGDFCDFIDWSLADAERDRWRSRRTNGARFIRRSSLVDAGSDGELADSNGGQSWDGQLQSCGQYRQRTQDRRTCWEDAEWIACTDGKTRPVEPGTFPLAHGLSARVGRLRGYGNAIVPQVAQVFIEAYLETGRQG